MSPWSEVPVVLHIGLPKCASTFLQARIFFAHPDIEFLGIVRNSDYVPAWREGKSDYAVHDFLRMIKETEELVWDPAAAVATLPATPPAARPVVISDEDLAFADKVDRSLKARRLKQLFPQGRVIAVLRNQFDWIESYYLFELRHLLDYVSFEDWLEKNWRKFEKSHLRVIRYRALLALYRGLFGADNVKVMCHEALRADAEGFIAELCGFLGVDPARLPDDWRDRQDNVRMPQSIHNVARHAPLLYRARALVPPAMRHKLRTLLLRAGRPARVELSSEWRQRITDFCGAENRALAEEWDLPLAEWGYPW